MLQSCAEWMFKEWRWRNATSATWTWCISFMTLGAYLCVWSFTPYRHIYLFYDYLLLISTPKVWLLLLTFTTIFTICIKLFGHHYKVTARFPTSRLEVVCNMIHPSSMFFVLCHGVFGAVIVGFSCSFTSNRFYPHSITCATTSGNAAVKCFNEASFMLILFGFAIGVANHMMTARDQLYSLRFPIVQQNRLLSVKCHSLGILLSSMKRSAYHVQYYAILYYLFGFILRDYVAQIMDLPPSDCYALSIFTMLDSISTLWTLWIVGILFLFLFNSSLHMFNICHTEMYPFPIDSVFPEDSSKLLTANLNEKQPALIQHLAFQRLAFIACHSLNARKQIFALGPEGVSSKAIKWNITADQCLLRLTNLTEKLNSYHLESTSSAHTVEGVRSSSKSTSTSALSASTLLNSSELRRRPLRSDDPDAGNLSLFEASALDSTSIGVQSKVNSPFRTNTTLPVPTPKLWTRQFTKTSDVDSVPGEAEYPAKATFEADTSMKTITQYQLLIRKFNNSMKRIPVVAYFLKEMPERDAINVFSDHYIHTWALQSISFLTAASFTEDRYGVVQRRLPDVLAVLLNLYAALEKYSKLPAATTSSKSMSGLLRVQRGLRTETKSALYRITNTFANHLGAIPVSAEHQRKLRSFVEHRE